MLGIRSLAGGLGSVVGEQWPYGNTGRIHKVLACLDLLQARVSIGLRLF